MDVRLLASFRGARVEEAEQPHVGILIWDGQRLLIRVRASDSEERRRFTVCHEICHTFFPGFRESPRTRTDRDVERFDPRDPEEYLCDHGAAELLLPRPWLLPSVPKDFTLDDVIEIAARSRASIEAAAQRCVDLSTRPVAVVMLERAGATGAPT
ncbi:MAG: ImmA/IrrE family metallo-endopeptidase, partial [Actinomycetota bacterium]